MNILPKQLLSAGFTALCLAAAPPLYCPVEAAVTTEASAAGVRVIFEGLPQSADEIAPAKTPEETAALTVAALVRFSEDPAAGTAMMNALRGPRPLSKQEVQLMKDQLLKDRDYVARSYFDGSVPENDYTPALPHTVTVSENPHSYDQENYATLYIQSGGADSPRPVTLRLKPSTGEWYLWNHVGLLPGIRIPASKDVWR